MMWGAKRDWRKILLVALFSGFFLAVGLIAGFFIGKSSVGSSNSSGSSSSSIAPDATQYKRGLQLSVDPSKLRQLPRPGSNEAAALQSGTGTPGFILALYTYALDASLITEMLTVAFLQELQQQLVASQLSSSSSSSSSNASSVDVRPFISLARDVLSYLRYSNSQALLPLLRQYSNDGTITLSDVGPDTLQTEVAQLLNVTTLSKWYGAASTQDTDAMQTLPPPSLSKVAPELQSSNNAHRRHLLLQHRHQHTRKLHAAASIPVIPDAKARAAALLPTESPEMTLQDMLCAVESYSPTGLQGLTLPPAYGGVNGSSDSSSSSQIQCKPPKLGLFQYNQVAFRPLVVPVVFHCQRYAQGDLLQPPFWAPEESARNLITVTNKLYKGTGIQFKMQEVRYDVKKYPYLLLATQEDWHGCSANLKQDRLGFPCLTQTAQFPEVASLAEKYVINVFVSGSTDPTAGFCNPTEASICQRLYLGFSRAIGPWFSNPSPTWREGFSDENWVFMTWDMFNPHGRNAGRFWDGGAVTLAHEFGHYLGLMHTHEGSAPCDGDGFEKADAVPDTPVNLDVNQYAGQNNLLVNLTTWCSDFRTGNKPSPSKLLVFNSCSKPNRVDNVFNLLSYTPDPCCMILTENQVARLQWSTASFRPKMVEAYQV